MKKLSRGLLIAAAFALVACGTTGASERAPSKVASDACGALGDAAKAAAPFYEAGGVYAARPLSRTVSRTRAFENRQIAGAELYMHAGPGVTPEYLQRALTCHAASGKVAHANDPLHPAGGVDEIDVRSTGAGFAVALTSKDRDTAKEIWQRSQVFAGEGGAVDVRQIQAD